MQGLDGGGSTIVAVNGTCDKFVACHSIVTGPFAGPAPCWKAIQAVGTAALAHLGSIREGSLDVLAVLGALGAIALLEVLGVFVAVRKWMSTTSTQSSATRAVPPPDPVIVAGDSPPSPS